MKLFINAGVCERKWNNNVKFEELPNENLKLLIPNYSEAKKEYEYVGFSLPNCKEKDLERDKLFEAITLTVVSPESLYQIYNYGTDMEFMFALLRSANSVIPDDIFIPASMKEKVTVMQRIRFVDDEVDYGDFLSNVYLIKIKLNKDESLPVYMSYQNPNSLNEHYVFYRSDYERGEYKVSELLKTYILINDDNRDDYVSLSSLCK